MNESSANETRVAQFAQIARNYTQSQSKQFAALLPYRESIIELRTKGASFSTIASLFKETQLKVAPDTIRRFYREVVEEKVKGKSSKHGGKAPAKPAVSSVLASTPSTANADQSQSSITQKPFIPPAPAVDVPRSRGPRIADSSKF